jgi:AcrR family transcriptional regulator
MSSRPRGRRAGPSTARDDILRTAVRLFAERGHDRTSLRRIADEAGVDHALVIHYFGSKQRLLVAAIDLPVSTDDLTEVIDSGPSDAIGARVAAFVVGLLEDPERGHIPVAMLRAAASDPEAAATFQAKMTDSMLLPIAEHLGHGDAQTRAALALSQISGLIVTRCMIGVEPLASLPPDEVAGLLAPILQRYLTGELGDAARVAELARELPKPVDLRPRRQ